MSDSRSVAAPSVTASGAGVSVPRRFTEAGKHPFECVEWEIRDALIGDPAKPAFEQRGVEFPKGWSQNATNIVAQKYFRGRLDSPERERSVKQMIGRVAGTIAAWGREGGYFASNEDAQAFEDELTHILLHQMAAFNSPVWFNCGWHPQGSPKNQMSACFILSVEDNMESILAWNTKEGMIFRGGSGSGVNLSKIRGSMEPLSKGGVASGPVSFMRGADAWAGSIKSGGGTRRAAKMIVLDVDHPDILDFIWCKAREEEKAAALRDAGFDMRLDSDAFASIQYQNANNSVRVTDEFMERAERGEDWELVARTDGSVVKRVNARNLLNQIADAAWRCADPGVQYDTTINEWHTCPNSGRINASNPCCFTGETLVHTIDGPIQFSDLHGLAKAGEPLPEVEAFDTESGTPVTRQINAVWIAGETAELVEVETSSGQRLRCTPDHQFMTGDGRFVEAQDLSQGDRLFALRSTERDAGAVAQIVIAATTDTVLAVQRVTLGHAVSVYDLEVDGVHNFAVTSHGSETPVVVHNSEYMHVDDSACNLASLNLMKFRREDGTIHTEAFGHAVDVMILAQEIIVTPSSYPTEEIGRNARAFRQLGLGYTNLGALLMSNGLAYDSDEAGTLCAAVTALMTGRAYRTSAEIAGAIGPYERYEENREPHNHVMRKHRHAAYEIEDSLCVDAGLLAAARRAWDEAVDIGARNGYRNAQSVVIAPTGTISFLLDSDTTGIEPDYSLVKFKELVGGGQMTIVNRTVPLALQTLGYSQTQIEQIESHLAATGTIIGAPGLRHEHLPVFDVAVGERAISPMGHIKMMSAAQPFVSGAISKCVVGSTLLATERGLVRIGSLRRNEAPDTFSELALRLASLGGARPTDAFYYGGERPVMEVRLRSGHRVTGTPNHRVLIGDGNGLEWRRLDELEPGDRVATKYGDELWAPQPPRFEGFVGSDRYGSQKTVTIPEAMTEDLAFFLGAYAAEGHIARGTWTIKIANADEHVLARLVDAGERLFGLRPCVRRHPSKCPSVELSSKTLVEFFDYLGTGNGAAHKRIPNAVLASPRELVLSFLEGLTLDSYLPASVPKWAICLASRELLDDLQAILTNLGIVHSRIEKYNPEYDRSFEEVYTTGRHAQRLLEQLRFPERHKALRAAQIVAGDFAQSTADVVPGTTGSELYNMIPRGRAGRSGAGTGRSREFSYLKDGRTREVSRTSLERVATLEEIGLPNWLDQVLEDNLYFSPVVSVEDAGAQDVFDVSVPGPHAFVANGIVNHNTVNLPESATVENIENLYVEGWKLGLKALAIYRDGSKTAQALRTDTKKEEPAKAGDTEIEPPRPRRRRMPRERQSITHKFSIAGHEGYITAGMYEDGTVGEIFLTDIGKEGSTLRGMMNAFATSISIALQYGVPLETLVRKFSYMRFDPEGITTNPEIPFAKSMPDYIMRWLASRFLDADIQEELGILTPQVRERKAREEALLRGDGPAPEAPANGEAGTPGNGHPKAHAGEPAASGGAQPAAAAFTDTPPTLPAKLQGLDLGPACAQCGGMMQRTGSCYTCSSCGNNTGCG